MSAILSTAQASDNIIGSTATATTEAVPDIALLRSIAAGNQLAMRVLFARHQTRVYRFALRMSQDAALAEDVVSDVFLDVWRKAAEFEGRSSVSTWLLSIARHKALTALGRRREAPLDEEMAANVPDSADDPELALHRNNTSAALRQCLSKLSAEHREVIDLVYYHEKSPREVAEIVNISEATVKTRMFYARKKLAGLLGMARMSEVELERSF